MGLDISKLLKGVDPSDILTILTLYAKYKDKIDDLFSRQEPAKPTTPKPSVVPFPVPDEDDVPLNPTTPKKEVASGRLSVVWMQLNRDRFPEQYTPENPFGLLSQREVQAILSGQSALNFESAVRFDTKFVDDQGDEVSPEDVHRLGLAWKSKWTVRNVETGEESFLQGQGSTYTNAKGKQEAFVEEVGARETGVGQGTRNYTDTLGFGQRMDFYKEGTYEIFMEIAGVQTNSLTFKVS